MDLDAFAADVIRIARRIWRFNIGRGVGREIMSIRFTFSVMGSGNPFYPDAFVEGEEISFPTRHVQIYSIDDIVPAIREIISEMYFVDSEVTMLFLEHVEFIKSNKVFVEQT